MQGDGFLRRCEGGLVSSDAGEVNGKVVQGSGQIGEVNVGVGFGEGAVQGDGL